MAQVEIYDCIKKIISASRALSELKGNNQLKSHTFIDTINLQEAQASSAIENNYYSR
jgi:hypothetical protein